MGSFPEEAFSPISVLSTYVIDDVTLGGIGLRMNFFRFRNY